MMTDDERDAIAFEAFRSAIAADKAAVIAAAVAAEREACAKIVDDYLARAICLHDSAKRRYAKRRILEAAGYQGDPDAECIHLEAMVDAAIDIAKAIREQKT